MPTDWSALRHAYGPATDVPENLRALRSPDEETRHEALGELFSSIVHQGSRFSASAAAVPELLRLLDDPAVPDREFIGQLLALIAIGGDEVWLPGPVRVDELRAAGAEDELAAYHAVAAGLPVLRRLAAGPDHDLALIAAYLIGWLPARDAVPVDFDRPEPAVAVAVVATGLIGRPEGVPVAARAFADERPRVRWAGAIALAGLRGPQAGPEVRAELLAWASSGRPVDPEMPYLAGDLAGHAALSLRLTGADAFDACLARLRQVRAEPALTVLSEALRWAFPDGPVPSGTPFAALTDRQQRLARVLAASPGSWRYDEMDFGNFAGAVRDHGLPGDRAAMAAYVD